MIYMEHIKINLQESKSSWEKRTIIGKNIWFGGVGTGKTLLCEMKKLITHNEEEGVLGEYKLGIYLLKTIMSGEKQRE